MVIERDARRFIYDLSESVNNTEYFIQAVANLNSVANVTGQGRQDFTSDLLYLVRELDDEDSN